MPSLELGASSGGDSSCISGGVGCGENMWAIFHTGVQPPGCFSEGPQARLEPEYGSQLPVLSLHAEFSDFSTGRWSLSHKGTFSSLFREGNGMKK